VVELLKKGKHKEHAKPFFHPFVEKPPASRSKPSFSLGVFVATKSTVQSFVLIGQGILGSASTHSLGVSMALPRLHVMFKTSI
jgi:hypothetical protein